MTRVQIPRASDKTLHRVAELLVLEHGFTVASMQLMGCPQVAPIDIKDKNTDIMSTVLLDKFLISNFLINKNGFSIYYYRGGQTEPRSAFVDELNISDSYPLAPEEHYRVANILFEHLHANLQNAQLAPLESGHSNLLAVHSSIMERLESLAGNVVSDTLEFRKQLDLENEKKVIAFGAYKQKEIKEFEEYKNREQNKIDSEFDVLKEEKEKLEFFSNTHERRKLFRKMMDEIKERGLNFKLSKNTSKLRAQVITIMILLVFLSLAIGYQLNETYKSIASLPTITMVERLSAKIQSTIYFGLGIGTLIYGVRWFNDWFEQHSKVEFQNKQFELDMTRASWLV